MQNQKQPFPESLYIDIELILEQSPAGIKEFDLLHILKEKGYFSFLKSHTLPHELFRAHFILFHILYLLRDRFLEEKKHSLEIDALKIILNPYTEPGKSISRDDKLRSYYLDISNLENTSEEEIYNMLSSFWQRYHRFEGRSDALAELGLEDPVDEKIIKQKYRKLMMEHHPDRGGNSEKVQKLNSAIKQLLG